MKIPAGKYYLGDPGYAIEKHERWLEILESSHYLDEPFIDDGKVIMGFSTTHGDGTYEDNLGNLFPVDGGMIGLVQVGFPGAVTTCPKGMLEVEFGEGALAEEDSYGVLTFGKHVIETDPVEEDEEPWEEDDIEEDEEEDDSE